MSKIKPFNHQSVAINNILYSNNGLLKKNRTQFISACGTGKTYTALWSVEKYLFEELKLDNSITVFFYPSLALISQSFNDYKTQTTIKTYNPLFICSENKIASDDEDIKIDELKQNIGNHIVTTDKSEVLTYLKNDTQHKVIYSTYQSSHLIVNSINSLNMRINIAVYDEAHNIALKKNDRKNATTSILHDKDDSAFMNNFLNVDKRLFMTATAKHFDIKVKQNDEEYDVELAYSMDNKKFFGEISHEYSMREAIEEDVIADYKIVAIHIEENFIKEYFNNAVIEEEHIEIVKSIAIVKAMEKYSINKAIIFNKNIEYSKIFTENVKKHHRELIAEHIDGRMGIEQRNNILTDFSNRDKFVLSNSKLLSEGVDIPAVDMVAFMSTTKSLRDIVQRVGRAQRIPKSHRDNNMRKVGYIFVPFVDDEVKTTYQTEFTKNQDAKLLYYIVNSLKNADKQLADVMEQKISSLSDEEYSVVSLRLQTLLSKKKRTPLEEEEIRNLQLIINSHDFKKKKFIIENLSELDNKKSDFSGTYHNNYGKKKDIFYNHIDAILLNSNYKNEKNWNLSYLAVKEFYGINKSLPSLKDILHNMNIGSWVQYQVTLNKRGVLPIDKYQKLIAIDKDFFKSKYEEDWTKFFNALKRFFAKNNRLPGEAERFNTLSIGRWLINQRALFKTNTLNEDRVLKLKKIDSYILLSVHDKKWQKNYELLVDYFERNNKFPKQSEPKIGYWFHNQLREHKSNILNKWKEEKLLQIDRNIFLQNNFDKRWQEKYELLVNYYDSNNSLPTVDESELGIWVNNQKSRYAGNVLSADRIDKLKSVNLFP